MSGQRLGRYELRERLGRGGMAEVYKAYQSGMDRFVALKLLLGHLADDDQFIERFRREAQAVGKLRHPHIVNVFDFGIENDVYYMVMEYIQGGNLKEYLNQKGRLPLQEALAITAQLADALDYAHNAGMVHRDLKPANVMFDNSKAHSAILTDFGIARILTESALTMSGMMVGTPAYMSPEAGNAQPADERADIYALGIMLYEMITGSVPYSADTPLAIVMKHISAPLPSLEGWDLPDAVELIILQAMAKNPDERFQTAADMRDRLRAAMPSAQDYVPPSTPPPVVDPYSSIGSDMTAMPPLSQEVQSTNAVPLPSMPDPTKESDPTAIEMSPKAVQKALTQYNRTTVMGMGAALVVVLLIIAAVVLLGGGDGGDDDESNNDSPSQAAIVAAATEAATEAPSPATTETATEAPTEAATEAPTENPTEAPTEAATEAPTETPTEDARPPTPVAVAALPDYVEAAPGTRSGLSETLDIYDQIALEEGLDVAVERLSEALEADPDAVDALVARSMLLSIDYRLDEALADAERAIELEPENPLAHLALTDVQLYLDNIDEARAALQEANARFGTAQPAVMWRMSQIAWASADDAGARDWLHQAEEAGAQGFRFNRYTGGFYYEHDDFVQALPYLVATFTTVPFWSYDVYFRLIGSYILLGEEEAAYNTAQVYAEIFGDVMAYETSAYAAYRHREFSQAEDWANAALAIGNNLSTAPYILALIAHEEARYTEAARIYESLSNADYFSDWPLMNFRFGHDLRLDYAATLMALGETEAAIDQYSDFINENGYWVPAAYLLRGDALAQMGNIEDAIVDYRDGYNVARWADPSQLPILRESLVSAVYGDQARMIPSPEDAPSLLDYESSVPFPTNLSDIHNDVDRMLFLEGNEAGAMAYLNTILEENPRDSEALSARVFVYLWQGNREAATTDLAQLVENDPDNPLTPITQYEMLTYWEVGDEERALAIMRAAHDAHPDNAAITWRLARSEARNGNDDSSQELWALAAEQGAQGFRYAYFLRDIALNEGNNALAFEAAVTAYQAFRSSETLGTMFQAGLWRGMADELFAYLPSMQPTADNDVSLYTSFSLIALEAEEADAALAYAQLGLALAPETADVNRYMMGLVYATGFGDNARAIELMESSQYNDPYAQLLLRIDFGYWRPYDLAKLYLAEANYTAAVDILNAFIPEVDWWPQPYITRAEAYYNLGEFDMALEDLRSARNLMSEDDPARRMIAQRIGEIATELANQEPSAE